MDYSRLSYEINIYTPAIPPFWENIAYVIIFYKISSSEQKRTWFVTQIHIATKKARHKLKVTIVVFHTK